MDHTYTKHNINNMVNIFEFFGEIMWSDWEYNIIDISYEGSRQSTVASKYLILDTYRHLQYTFMILNYIQKHKHHRL